MLILIISVAMIVPATGFAGQGTLTAPNNPTNLTSFQLSKNVTITFHTSNNSYALITSHEQGDTLYGAGSNDSAVYKDSADKTEGTAYTTTPTASDSSEFNGGGNWERM